MPSKNLRDGRKPGSERASRSQKRIASLMLIVVIIILIAIAAVMVIMRQAEDQRDAPREARRVSVEIAPVIGYTLHDTVTGVGTLNPIQTVEIKPEISGRLLTANFREGDFIDKGQVLFEIDDEKITHQFEARKAALASARTRLENLRRNYDRVASLHERDLVSEERYDSAKTELEAVTSDVKRIEAELGIVERELADTVIRSPFTGYISRQHVDPGTVVQAGQPLAVIYETDPLQLSFFITEKYMGRVSRGQNVAARVTAFPNRSFSGDVDFIAPVIDEGTRRFRVRANIENPGHEIMPGSFASATLILETRNNRPVVPEQAIVPTRTGYIVYVVSPENQTASIKQVKTGLRKPGLVEIADGLSVGEMVVVYGHMQLDEGSAISILETWDETWPDRDGSNRRGTAGGVASFSPGAAIVRGG